MKWFVFIAVHLVVAISFFGEAHSADQVACKNFKIVFDEHIQTVPPLVYSNGEKIGTVDLAQERSGNLKHVSVCIDSRYAGKFEKNSVCYVSKDQIVVYTVWSTGIGLKEGETVKGFTSRLGLYAYEAKELYGVVRDEAMALLLELIGKVLGTESLSKAQKAYEVIAK